mmetsp:Transcript_39287/g.124893  ORF Transcript_39287/g.124893 Transcript_39287/m.124893 type:complete len:120 (-) Transcript_39287:338-697(-)
MRLVSPCIFGAPAWPAASTGRLLTVCEATHEGRDSLPDRKPKLDPPGKRPLPARKEAECASEGAERLRLSSVDEALEPRVSEWPSRWLGLAAGDSGAEGSGGRSYQEPSLMPLGRPPLL